MVKGKFVLRFSSTLVEQPVIYRLAKEYDLVINILKADINPHKEGFVVLELSGNRENYHNGLEYIKSLGVGVKPLSSLTFDIRYSHILCHLGCLESYKSWPVLRPGRE